MLIVYFLYCLVIHNALWQVWAILFVCDGCNVYMQWMNTVRGGPVRNVKLNVHHTAIYWGCFEGLIPKKISIKLLSVLNYTMSSAQYMLLLLLLLLCVVCKLCWILRYLNSSWICFNWQYFLMVWNVGSMFLINGFCFILNGCVNRKLNWYIFCTWFCRHEYFIDIFPYQTSNYIVMSIDCVLVVIQLSGNVRQHDLM